MKLIDRTGHRYERLEVMGRAPRATNPKDTNARWHCKCDCGTWIIAYGQDLARGKVKSCGCMNAEQRVKHGLSYSRTYGQWKQMVQRCENPNHRSYENYGGRGIAVAPDWKDFKAFYRDMGASPKGRTLDRIDNSKGYSKDNCRWAARRAQDLNKRTNRVLEHNGKRLTVTEWAELLGINRYTLFARIRYGWPVERILAEPVRQTPP